MLLRKRLSDEKGIEGNVCACAVFSEIATGSWIVTFVCIPLVVQHSPTELSLRLIAPTERKVRSTYGNTTTTTLRARYLSPTRANSLTGPTCFLSGAAVADIGAQLGKTVLADVRHRSDYAGNKRLSLSLFLKDKESILWMARRSTDQIVCVRVYYQVG